MHPSGVDESDAVPVLRQLDEFSREQLGLSLPSFAPEVAMWAARLIYQISRFVICRDLGQEAIRMATSEPCPAPHGPETDWSADLTLRHLPALCKLARQVSNADPLLEVIRRLAAEWPLSSAGIPGLTGLRTDSIYSHPALLRLYADRVLAAGDTSRLGHRKLDAVLRADLGLHPDLAPAFAAKLFEDCHDTR